VQKSLYFPYSERNTVRNHLYFPYSERNTVKNRLILRLLEDQTSQKAQKHLGRAVGGTRNRVINSKKVCIGWKLFFSRFLGSLYRFPMVFDRFTGEIYSYRGVTVSLV